MIVLMFQPRFVGAVLDGTKTQTIRPRRKRPVRPGDPVSLRTWTGLPYRSKQRVLREAWAGLVRPILIEADGVTFQGESKLSHGFDPRSMNSLDVLARLDGFADWADMIGWFEKNHALPFEGELITWSRLRPCPFCRGDGSMAKHTGVYVVQCGTCGASGSLADKADEALRLWNTRP